jgi:hypothetical protein
MARTDFKIPLPVLVRDRERNLEPDVVITRFIEVLHLVVQYIKPTERPRCSADG